MGNMLKRRKPSRNDRIAYIIKVTSMVLDGLGVPKHSSKFCKRIYDDHWLFSLLIVRQYLDLSYRELCSLMPSIKGMKKIPDHSTVAKFSERAGPNRIRDVMQTLSMFVCGDGMTVAVDSTGFSCSNASRHYVKRINKTDRGNIEYSNDLVRGFSKATFAVDTETKMILSCDSADSVHSDVRRMPFIIDDLVSGGFDIRNIVADKGYDAEYIHSDVKKKLGAQAIIPVRANTPKKGGTVCRTRGVNRSRMKRELLKDTEMMKKYNLRAMSETANSMVKRKMGDTVYGRSELSRRKEVLFRCAAHNFRRLLDLEVVL
jgi:transposase